MDQLRLQCQVLAQQISQEGQLGLSSQQIAALVEVVWPHLHGLHLTRTGELRKKDRVRLRSWLGDGHRCCLVVAETSAEHEWGLTQEQITTLASAVLPHARTVFHARMPSGAGASIRNVIVHYYSDSGMVAPLLALVGQPPESPPERWASYLLQVCMVEYDLTAQQATDFVSGVWPHILRCLHRYHYSCRLLTWIYQLVDNYREDGEVWGQLQEVTGPVMESLLVGCLADPGCSDSQRSKRVQTLGHKAGLPAEALGKMQYVADCACRLFAQDPGRLALQASADIHAGLPGFCFGSRLTTWLHQVILNSRKKILQELDQDPVALPTSQDENGEQIEWAPPAPGPLPDREAVDRELVEQIRRAIHSACLGMHDRPIPRWKKEWIGHLRFVQDEEHQVISEITGVNVNTVMTVVARIKPYLLDAPWLADYLPVLNTVVDRLDRGWQRVLDPGQPARSDEALNYRVSVANTGQADASAVRVEVAIPLGTQLTEGSLGTRPPGTAPAFHDLTEGVIVWQGGLRAGEQMSLVYTLQLLPPGSPPEMLVQQVRVRLGRQRVAIAELTTQLESE